MPSMSLAVSIKLHTRLNGGNATAVDSSRAFTGGLDPTDPGDSDSFIGSDSSDDHSGSNEAYDETGTQRGGLFDLGDSDSSIGSDSFSGSDISNTSAVFDNSSSSSDSFSGYDSSSGSVIFSSSAMFNDEESVVLYDYVTSGVADWKHGASKDWILVNLHNAGNYIVNYQNSNWWALIRQLRANHLVGHML